MKNRKVLYIIIAFLIISIITLTVAYSALNTLLKINGTSEIQQANWNIRFNKIKVKAGSIKAIKKATIQNHQQVTFEIKLNKPGDFYEFTVDIINDGSIDAMIDSIIKTPELTPTQQKYALYEITYDDGNSIGLKQLLKSKTQKTLKVRVAYKTDLTASDLPKNPDSLNLSFQAIFTQANENSVVGPEGSGNEIIKIAQMVSGDISNPQIGDMFAIKNERFHIYSSTATTVTGIAEFNLYVGDEYNYDTNKRSSYGREAKGIQNSDMIGWSAKQNIWKGITEFSSDTKKGTNYNDYKGSIVEEYVNNYNDMLTGYGVQIEEARLITIDELMNIFKCPTNDYCPTTYPWIYTTTYWTSSPSGVSDIWGINSDGEFSSGYYYKAIYCGVRPVITVLKSEFK